MHHAPHMQYVHVAPSTSHHRPSTAWTRDQFFRPGPGGNQAFLYYYSGFVWIQDMIDRAYVHISLTSALIGLQRHACMPCHGRLDNAHIATAFQIKCGVDNGLHHGYIHGPVS
jgi:hypothetical protein